MRRASRSSFLTWMDLMTRITATPRMSMQERWQRPLSFEVSRSTGEETGENRGTDAMPATAFLTSSAIPSVASRIISPSRLRDVPASFASEVIASIPWHLRWGATPQEVSVRLPGDDLIRHSIGQTTRAISIQAPPDVAWNKLLQLLTGSADAKLLEGGTLLLPQGEVMEVVSIIPGRCVTLFQLVDTETGQRVSSATPAPRSRMEWSLTYNLVPTREGCRLLARSRMANTPRHRISEAFGRLVEMPHFIDERQLLVDVKSRAEQQTMPAEHSRKAASRPRTGKIKHGS